MWSTSFGYAAHINEDLYTCSGTNANPAWMKHSLPIGVSAYASIHEYECRLPQKKRIIIIKKQT
jgi:hypothetical protein